MGYGILRNVSKVAEKFMMLLRKEVQCCFVEYIPRHNPRGKVSNGVSTCFLSERSGGSGGLDLRQAELLLVLTFCYHGHAEGVWKNVSKEGTELHILHVLNLGQALRWHGWGKVWVVYIEGRRTCICEQLLAIETVCRVEICGVGGTGLYVEVDNRLSTWLGLVVDEGSSLLGI